MKTQPFRSDNTEGYTDAQLNALNAEFERLGGGALDPFEQSDDYKGLVERVQSEFDSCQVSDDQIRQLRTEAGAAGDREQVALCDRALAGDAAARAECAEVIGDAAREAAAS